MIVPGGSLPDCHFDDDVRLHQNGCCSWPFGEGLLSKVNPGLFPFSKEMGFDEEMCAQVNPTRMQCKDPELQLF